MVGAAGSRTGPFREYQRRYAAGPGRVPSWSGCTQPASRHIRAFMAACDVGCPCQRPKIECLFPVAVLAVDQSINGQGSISLASSSRPGHVTGYYLWPGSPPWPPARRPASADTAPSGTSASTPRSAARPRSSTLRPGRSVHDNPCRHLLCICKQEQSVTSFVLPGVQRKLPIAGSGACYKRHKI